MAGTTWHVLRSLLLERYEYFRGRLARHLGSEELASESLHETWLRLQREGEISHVRSPSAYLLRIAANIAKDNLRAERRRAATSETLSELEIADPAPDPARSAQANLDIEIFRKALGELSARTQKILIASRIEGLTHQEVADRLGISRRTVLYELKRAVQHLDDRLENNPPPGCTPASANSSAKDAEPAVPRTDAARRGGNEPD